MPPEPEWSSDQLAVSERGQRLNHFTEADVTLALNVLIQVGGNVTAATEALAENGLLVKHAQLRYLRDVQFPRRYMEIRAELSADQSERIAGDAMDRALRYGEAQEKYLDAAMEKVDEVSPDRLAAAARDLARAAGENINGAQILRNKPTQIIETRDTNELLDQLERLGVVQRDPRFAQSAPSKVERKRAALEVSATEIEISNDPADNDGADAELAAEIADAI